MGSLESMRARSLDDLVTTLVPSLANSLAEQFNVFRVMHHGTHEKQLSNVFAWLLRADGTHQLGATFQRLLVEKVHLQLAEVLDGLSGGDVRLRDAVVAVSLRDDR